MTERRLTSEGDQFVMEALREAHEQAKAAEANNITATITAQRLQQLDQYADELVRGSVPIADRLIHLRETASELELNIRDGELRRVLADAKRRLAGVAESLGSRPLSLAAVPWMVEGLLLQNGLNVLLAPPKVGKTSLVVSLISQWVAGAETFLGQRITAPCPPVLLVGPDMPECDWARMLRDASLLTTDLRLKDPIVDLFTAGQPLQLDDEGIERIANYAEQHPGLLVVIDSLAAVTRQLGIEENNAEIAQPVSALVEVLEAHGATLLLIHHSNKARIGDSPSLASRGSSALPALASQTVGLHRLNQTPQQGKSDRRVVLKTEGRGGMPLELLIERVDAHWICHGDAEAVQLERHMQEVESKLSERQIEALAAVRDRWELDGQPMDAMELGTLLGLDGKGPRDGERKARATLDQLAAKGLLSVEVHNTGVSRRKVFKPLGGTKGGVSPTVSQASQASQPDVLNDAPKPQKPYGERDGRVGVVERGVRRQGGWEPPNLPAEMPPLSQPVIDGLAPVIPLRPLPARADSGDDPHWPPRSNAKPSARHNS